MRQKDFSELHEPNGKSEPKGLMRNVNCQFQDNPHNIMIDKHKEELFSKNSPLQNAKSNGDEEN